MVARLLHAALLTYRRRILSVSCSGCTLSPSSSSLLLSISSLASYVALRGDGRRDPQKTSPPLRLRP